MLIPACFHSASAAPMRTRSDCFGLKLGHGDASEVSAFLEPPVQPAPPRSPRFNTVARAAACPAGVSRTCHTSAATAPAPAPAGPAGGRRPFHPPAAAAPAPAARSAAPAAAITRLLQLSRPTRIGAPFLLGRGGLPAACVTACSALSA